MDGHALDLCCKPRGDLKMSAADEGKVRPAVSKLPSIPMLNNLKTEGAMAGAEQGRRRSIMSWAVGINADFPVRGALTRLSPMRGLRSMIDLTRYRKVEEAGDEKVEQEEQEKGSTRGTAEDEEKKEGSPSRFHRLNRRRSLIIPREADYKEIMGENEATTFPANTGAKLRLKHSRNARESSIELAEAHSSSTKTNRDAGRPPLHQFHDLDPPTEQETTRTTKRTAMLFRLRRLRTNGF